MTTNETPRDNQPGGPSVHDEAVRRMRRGDFALLAGSVLFDALGAAPDLDDTITDRANLFVNRLSDLVHQARALCEAEPESFDEDEIDDASIQAMRRLQLPEDTALLHVRANARIMSHPSIMIAGNTNKGKGLLSGTPVALDAKLDPDNPADAAYDDLIVQVLERLETTETIRSLHYQRYGFPIDPNRPNDFGAWVTRRDNEFTGIQEIDGVGIPHGVFYSISFSKEAPHAGLHST